MPFSTQNSSKLIEYKQDNNGEKIFMNLKTHNKGSYIYIYMHVKILNHETILIEVFIKVSCYGRVLFYFF